MHLTTRSYVLMSVTALFGIVTQWTGWAGDSWRALAASQVLLLAWEALHTARQKFACQRVLTTQLHLGQSALLGLELRNHNLQPQRVQWLARLPDTLHGVERVFDFALAPGAASLQQLPVLPTALGELRWPSVPLRVRGALGLAWWERYLTPAGTASVTPARLSAVERRRALGGSGEVAGLRAGQGLELIGLRPYVPGDPLRNLDWKATARRGRPWLRLFAEDQRFEVLLMVDLSRLSGLTVGPLTRLAHYVNVAARLAEYAQRQGNAVGLLCFSDAVHEELRPASGGRSLTLLRAALAQARTRAVEPGFLNAALAARRMLSQRALVVVFSDLDIDDGSGQSLHGVRVLSARHLPLFASLHDEELLQQRERVARGWRDPYDILAANELDEAARINQARARHLGARIVTARAGDLDRAVLASYDNLRATRRL